MKANQKTPETLLAVTPMLAVREAAKSIEWYKNVFGAKEKMRLTDPAGTVVHAELQFNDSLIMIAEEHPDYNKSPQTLQGTSVILNISVPDVDDVYARALAAGAKSIFPVKDQFYGERAGRIEDPFGHMWLVSTHIKDVSAQEMQRQMSEMSEAS